MTIYGTAALRSPMPLPAGELHLSADLDDRLRAASGAAARDDGAAHPALAFVLALGGMGETIGDALQRCGYAIDQAPLLAGCEIDFQRPLRVDDVYQVGGELAAVTRKPSRRFGTADHLRFRFAFSAGHETIGSVTLTMVVQVNE